VTTNKGARKRGRPKKIDRTLRIIELLERALELMRKELPRTHPSHQQEHPQVGFRVPDLTNLFEAGLTLSEIADLTGISLRTVYAHWQDWCEDQVDWSNIEI
jgi:hypothetical protein